MTVTANGVVDALIPIGVPTQQLGVTGRVFVNSWVYGNSATAGTLNTYDVTIPTLGIYIFETSGAIGSCGFALELNTFITVRLDGGVVGSNDNTLSSTGHMTFPGSRCSWVSATLASGIVHRRSEGRWRSHPWSAVQSGHVPPARAKRRVIEWRLLRRSTPGHSRECPGFFIRARVVRRSEWK